MSKKGNDINLFNAASKADKKIQTGVSKSFLFVIAGIVVVIAIAAYVGLIIVDTQMYKTEINEYENIINYSTGINALSNRIEQDNNEFKAIQTAIDSANAIKHYSTKTLLLYPGLTNAQRVLITTKEYIVEGQPLTGCVPDGVINNLQEGKRVETIITDGLQSYTVIGTNDVESQVVFEKGYILLVFEGYDENLPQEYISNIVSRANSVFAIESGIADRSAITESSFEYGFFEKADPADPQSTNKYYVKAKLKSIYQIILEDEYINAHLLNMIKMDYSNGALTLELRTQNEATNDVASYLHGTGLFKSIIYRGHKILIVGDHLEYEGALVCHLTEGN